MYLPRIYKKKELELIASNVKWKMQKKMGQRWMLCFLRVYGFHTMELCDSFWQTHTHIYLCVCGFAIAFHSFWITMAFARNLRQKCCKYIVCILLFSLHFEIRFCRLRRSIVLSYFIDDKKKLILYDISDFLFVFIWFLHTHIYIYIWMYPFANNNHKVLVSRPGISSLNRFDSIW